MDMSSVPRGGPGVGDRRKHCPSAVGLVNSFQLGRRVFLCSLFGLVTFSPPAKHSTRPALSVYGVGRSGEV